MTTWIIVAVTAVLLLGLVLLYNSLVRRRAQVDNAWSQIDVQLRRRLDLIPNLVETVKGYAQFEKSTLDAVISARQSAMAAAPSPQAQASADNVVSGALRQLFALSEAYPDLKANQNFLSLQEQLAETESRVAYARQFYNDEVLRLNTAIQHFPTLIVARLFGFTEREYFDAGPEAQAPPKVSFN